MSTSTYVERALDMCVYVCQLQTERDFFRNKAVHYEIPQQDCTALECIR